ncbi:MAG: polysaccharide deacetylase family protein [Cyanobacteria bacterium J06643_4]
MVSARPEAVDVSTDDVSVDSSTLLPLNPSAPENVKSRLRKRSVRFLHQLSYFSGASALYARLRTTSVATVLMYHSVPRAAEARWMDPRNCLSAERFEQQMQFLSRDRKVISIERLTQQLTHGERIERGTVAITFDDGYLNNLRVAAPILARYGLPATIYLATAYVTTGENQWIDTLYSAFRARSGHRLCLSEFGLEDATLSSAAQCERAYLAIAHHLITCKPSLRQAILATIDRQLAPSAYPPRLTMTWDDVRELRDRYSNITLGVHTANHIDLATHSEETDREVQLSIAQVLAETGERPNHLAFPYNRYNLEAQVQVAKYLRSAVATAPDPVVRADTSLYALPRLEAPQSLWLLKSWTDGGFPDTTQRLFGRAWTRST